MGQALPEAQVTGGGQEEHLDKLADQRLGFLSGTTHGAPFLVLGLPQQAEGMLKTPQARMQRSEARGTPGEPGSQGVPVPITASVAWWDLYLKSREPD